MDEPDLRQVVARASVYDVDAWDALYRRCYGFLFAYAMRRLADRTAAEDAVSETMTRALDRIQDFQWKGVGFDGWLYGILRNVVREAWRAQTRHDRVPTLPAPVADPPFVDALIADEEAAAVRLAFTALSAEDQEILELRVIAGMSAEAVAKVQGRRPGAVRMAQHRAIGRLREVLVGVGDE